MTSTASCLPLSFVFWLVCLAAAAAPTAEPARLSPDATEPQAIASLAQVRAGGDAYAAHLAMKAWLARHPTPSGGLLAAAGDTALAAGDLQAAAALYKRFIATAPADETRSLVAARLYEILVGRLQSNDDAYSFFVRSGFDLRQSLPARQFDSWFLAQAGARGDWVTASRILAVVMADKLPLELERNLYWEDLDRVMGELARATPDRHAAAPFARQIVGLVRESPARAARYGFITAWLEFQAAIAGKDAAAQAAAFAPVAAAAAAYVDAASTAATLNDLLNVFVCGTGGHQPWQTLGGPISALWSGSFEKLPDPEKAKVINWNGWWNFQANGGQWMELGAKFPAVFQKSPAARGLPLLVNQPDPAVFAKQATFLAGVPSAAARVVNAVHATKGTDLLAGLRHLSQSETSYGEFGDTWAAASSQVWPIYRSFPREPAATDADWYRALTAWGREGIARTPIALFQPDAAGAWLAAAFAAADPADKAAVAAELRRLDWVPWEEKSRQTAIKPAHTAFKQWAEQVRGQLTAAQKAAQAAADDKAKADEVAKWEKAAGQIGPLEEEFKKAFDVNVPTAADWSPLADPLAMHLGRCVQAIREKKLDAYVASAREAYKLVRNFPIQKSPFSSAAFRWLLTNRFDAFDIVDFQAEVIADQIAIWQPGQPTEVFTAIDTALGSGRNGGGYTNVPADRKGQALKLNGVIGQGILAQLAKNRFEPDLLTRFRYTKMGQGWVDQEAGQDVMAKLIDTKALLVHKLPRAVSTYQSLVRTEFQSLAKTYPVETFFDDMFVEESKATGWLDWNFLNYSRDEKQKAAGVAADMFAGYPGLAAGPNAPNAYDKLPQTLVAGDRRDVITRPATWTVADVNNWYGRALFAPAELRAKLVTSAEGAWGTTRFDGSAMGYASLPGDPAAVAAAAGRADFFGKLATILDRRRTYPARIGAPYLNALSQIPGPSFTPEELATVLAAFSEPSPPAWSGGSEQVGLALAQALLEADRDADLMRIAPEFWRIARETNPAFAAPVATFATGVAKAGKPGVAGAIAESGLQMLGQSLPDAARTQLAAIRTDAMLVLGGGNPVPRGDPRWPIYESQIQFAAGKLQGAWDLYAAHA
ncbi:MAG: hypothetical protein WED27_00895, partial [Pirellulales bacterium]